MRENLVARARMWGMVEPEPGAEWGAARSEMARVSGTLCHDEEQILDLNIYIYKLKLQWSSIVI